MKIKFKNVFWGLFFICSACLIIAHQLGYFPGVGFFSLIFTLLLIPVILKSIVHLNFFGILIPAALLIIIYERPLGLQAITPWPVLLAALFLSIGLSIIFHKHHWGFHHHDDHFGDRVENIEEDEFSFSESFSASSKYLNSASLRKANLRCSFGAMKVYFDNAELNPDGAEIHLECSFAGMELYIPKTWRVVNNIEAMLGGVEEKNKSYDVATPVLTLTGRVSFGGIEIIYV